jgi:spectrin beta
LIFFQGSLASIEEYGKDLPGVESLLRKHDELERNVILLNDSFEKMKDKGESLKRNETKIKQDLDLKITVMMENFARVNQLVVNR